jgi:uridine phosphorylase
MGSQEYTNAFNRYQTERNAQLNPLQSLAGMGQTTMTNLGTMGASNAANVGNLMTSGAAAQAAGNVGQTNAITGGLGTYLNYNQGNNLVAALRNRGGYQQPSNYGNVINDPYANIV